MVARKQSAFGGYNMFHWCEGSCCWFLRLQSFARCRQGCLVSAWQVGFRLKIAGSPAGWFEMFPRLCKVDRGCAAAWQVGVPEHHLSGAIQAVDWFVPEHHLSIGLRCRFCEVHRRHLMHGGTQTIRFCIRYVKAIYWFK